MKTLVKIAHQKILIFSFLFIWVHVQLGCSTDDSQGTDPVNAFGEVFGTILSEDGIAYANILVELKTSGGAVEASDVTDASGKYEIVQVPAGNYTLDVKPPLTSTVNSNGRTISVIDGQPVNQDFSFDIMWVDAFVQLDPIDPFGEVRNQNGEVPIGNEPIYTPFSVSNPDAGNPSAILAPDGHHITLNEWKAASGNALVTCDGTVTTYSLEFNGLIPNGVYTLWNGILKEHQDPESSLSFSNSFKGIGALKDGNSNSFVASAQGEAQMELSVEMGSLSMFGTQPPCAITGAKGFILVVDYHIDQNTHGPTPGPDYLEVAHLLIYF